MKEYEELNKFIKQWLEESVADDEHGLSAQTLYRNIYNSTGDEKSLALIFAVPVGLIRAVKEEGKILKG